MGTRKSFADIVRETEEDLRQRLQAKVPEWAGVLPELQLPARLNVEQCSSSAAARYKAELAARILQGANGSGLASPATGRIADLTGGLGVDAWAFSAAAEDVLYNEMDPALCEAVQANFVLLGVRNVVFRNAEVRPGIIREILGGFRPDLIYLDPARRSATGRKVFLLEDCRPDLIGLQDELFSVCPQLLVKLSPMADITLLRRRLKGVREVHIVSVDGECKELLLQLSAGEEETCQLTVTELSKSGTATLRFGPADKETRCPGLESASLREGNWLFEPGAALLKSACHDAACHRAGLRKLAPSTHLYIADSPDAALAGFGRFRQILDILPLDRHAMKEAGKRYPAAGVTARNIPMHSDELARRLGIRSGGSAHIYGTTVQEASERRVLIVTQSR